jgi:predicted Zn-dependent protease
VSPGFTRDGGALTRRQCCVGLVGLGALAAAGCASISPQEERELGRKEAEDVERTVGLVREPRLVAYVEAIGQRLAQVAARPDIAWRWAVADDSEANAFSVPGGWVYVTRGLLALSNAEDELAGVLAHEMAHVTERHAVRRVGAATPLAVLFGIPGGLLGTVSPTLGGIVGGTGRVLSGLALAPYNREQEYEADRVGAALAARAGWNPRALASFLGTMERADDLARGGPRPRSFLATHPSTPERASSIEALAPSLSRASSPAIAGSRVAFVGRLDGLVVGDNAANGVFEGPLFRHPDLDLAIEMPSGWKPANSPTAAGALAPDESGAVILQLVGSGDDPVAGARSEGLSEARLKELRRLQISDLPAAALTATTRDGARIALTWIAHRKRIFRVTGVCGTGDWERHRPAFERTAASFRPLRSDEPARIMESRLRLRPARAGESVAQVVARGGATWSAAQAAVANAVTPDRRLEADWPVKVAVRERYQAATGATTAPR